MYDLFVERPLLLATNTSSKTSLLSKREPSSNHGMRCLLHSRFCKCLHVMCVSGLSRPTGSIRITIHYMAYIQCIPYAFRRVGANTSQSTTVIATVIG